MERGGVRRIARLEHPRTAVAAMAAPAPLAPTFAPTLADADGATGSQSSQQSPIHHLLPLPFDEMEYTPSTT